MPDEMTSEEVRILADAHWRGKMEREAHAALLRADTNLPVVKEMYSRLMQSVPALRPSWDNAPDVMALRQLRRVIRVMNAFAGLSHEQRETLQGRLAIRHTIHKTGNEIAEIRVRLQREVWESHPDFLELRGKIDAEAERAAERARQAAADHQADLSARQQRAADAPMILLDLHHSGLRLDLDENGRLRVFPASLLTPEQKRLLASHGDQLAAAIKAEWMTA